MEEVHIHPEFNPVQYSADLAILQLTKSVKFNAFIQPICLWNESSETEDVVGLVGTVS